MDLGELRRTTPFSTRYGFDRGKPIDRRYIEAFLTENATHIRGRVLEIGDNTYTMRFGGAAVTQSDVFNRYEANAQTTFLGDLTDRDSLPPDTFDCMVITQTLHLIYDMPAAVATLHRGLRPGGVLLTTVPGITPIDRGKWSGTWFWSLTPASLSRLLGDPFGTEQVAVKTYGNVLSATGFLYGLAEHELTVEELDVCDPFAPVVVAAVARKSGG
jgi:SAM-dependent methyltransferase